MRKAVDFFGRAACQGDIRAQYALGDCYNQGKGIEKDLEKAGWAFLQAALQGHAEAQCALGEYCYKGLGKNSDRRLAHHFFEMSAQQGLPNAQKRIDELAQMKVLPFSIPEEFTGKAFPENMIQRIRTAFAVGKMIATMSRARVHPKALESVEYLLTHGFTETPQPILGAFALGKVSQRPSATRLDQVAIREKDLRKRSDRLNREFTTKEKGKEERKVREKEFPAEPSLSVGAGGNPVMLLYYSQPSREKNSLVYPEIHSGTMPVRRSRIL